MEGRIFKTRAWISLFSIFILFDLSFYPDCHRRIRYDCLDELERKYPQAARLIESNLTGNEFIQKRIAEIILRGSRYWHKKHGDINLNAVKTLVALGKDITRGDDRAGKILSAVEYLLNSYYLDEILARISSGDNGEKRGALAELLNLAYIKKHGINIDGQHYRVRVLASSISFVRGITLGKKQFDGLVVLVNSKTGEERYVLISSKNKNGLRRHSLGGLEKALAKDLKGVIKLHPGVYTVNPPLVDGDFSDLGVLFLLSGYGVSKENIENALSELNRWVENELSPDLRERIVGIKYCPIPSDLITYIQSDFVDGVDSLVD